MPLFDQWPSQADPLFVALRDGTHPIQQNVRAHVEELWCTYRPYAERAFPTAFAASVHSRYWEMFLTCQLLAAGELVATAATGPDIQLLGHPIPVWLEATAPGPGLPGLPDSVPEPELDSDRALPNPDRRLALRFSQAISEKALVQYPKHAAAGLVSASDPYVIALNGGGITDGRHDSDRTAILHVLFGMGGSLVVFGETGRIIETFHVYSPSAPRASGALVSTDLFLQPAFSHVSAVLFSSVDVANPGTLTGTDFLLAHNPNALVPLPSSALLGIRECQLSGAPQHGEKASLSFRIRRAV
jgi:hypothetical protein